MSQSVPDEVGAGETVGLTFAVKDPGVYEVETHESGLTLFKIEAR